MLADGPVFAFSPFARPDGAVGVDGGGRPGPVFFQGGSGPGSNVFEQLRGQAERWSGEGRRIVVAAWTRGSRERLANLLREHGFKDAGAGGRLGDDPPQACGLGVAGHAGCGARLRRR